VRQIEVKWNLNRTDIPFYDLMLKHPEYYKRAKGVRGEIEHMSPQEYIERAAKIFKSSSELVHMATSTPQIKVYADHMKQGDVFPIPVLDMAEMAQEGRHRVIAAEWVGAKTIPVLVVYPYGKVPMTGAKPQTTPKEPFVEIGERVRFIGSGRHRRGDWPEGRWLEYGVTGTVTEYHPEQPVVIVKGERFEALPPYAVARWDLGGVADSVIDTEDEGRRWERMRQ